MAPRLVWETQVMHQIGWVVNKGLAINLQFLGLSVTAFQPLRSKMEKTKPFNANVTKLNELAFSAIISFVGFGKEGWRVLNELYLYEMMTFPIFRTFILILCRFHKSKVSRNHTSEP